MHFEFAGETSEFYGLYNVNIGRGMGREPFVADAELIEEVIEGRDKPYFKDIKRRPLSFSVSFAFKETWDNDQIRAVARWLTSPKIYQPLRFYNDPENIDNSRIFFALFVESAEIVHNYLQQGYIILTVRCDAPWAYLPIEEYEEDDAGNSPDFTLTNTGDMPIYPRVKITKTTNDGAVVITNTENDTVIEFFETAKGSGLLKFTGTAYDGETISIGDEVYEFDTGDGEVGAGNILVDLYSSGSLDTRFAKGRLEFISGQYIKEGDTITIGNDVYEFDVDGYYRHANIPVDISSDVTYATGRLTLNFNPEPYDQLVIGNTRYIFDLGTNKSLIKTTNHGVDGRSGFFGIVNRSHRYGTGEESDELNFRFVVAKNRDFLQMVRYTGNNPFLNPTPIIDAQSDLENQQPEDVIEIYNSKYRGEVVSSDSTTSHLVTENTQGLRSGDVVGLLQGSALEFRKIKAVSNNVSMSLETAASEVPSVFYAFNRVALRVAEGAKFEIPNIVVIGTDTEESANNLVNAINLEGVPSLDFGINLKQNILVEAEVEGEYGGSGYDSVSIILTSRFAGSQGNAIVTTVSDGMDAYFDDDTLTGGQDCHISNAKSALITAFNEKGRENVVIDDDSIIDVIVFKYAIGGTIGNGIVCLANSDGARWVDTLDPHTEIQEYFKGGVDPTKAQVINALIAVINAESSVVENAALYLTFDDIIRVEHQNEGLDTNIPVRSNTYNAFWSSTRLTGGRNQLIVGEEIMIDCDREQVESNEDDFDRYDCFSDTYIRLDVGDNVISVSGNCNVTFWILPQVIQGGVVPYGY